MQVMAAEALVEDIPEGEEDLEFLKRGFRASDLYKSRNIDSVVETIIQTLGGREIIKQNFRTRRALALALSDIEFGEFFKAGGFLNNPQFVLPYHIIPDVSMNDTTLREGNVRDVVRDAIFREIGSRFLEIVFPCSRRKWRTV